MTGGREPGVLQRALARGALATARIPEPLGRWARPPLNALWLGLLSDPGLRALDERFYAGEDAYRTDEWNAKGLFPWERRLVDDHFADGGRVVVAACGGGREVLGLLDAGFDAVGYEPHPALVSYARDFLAARGHPDRAHPCARDEFPATAACDAAVIGWGAYSLMHGRETRVSFLSAARAQLPAGGPVLLSFFDRQADTRALRWVAEAAGTLRGPRRGRPLELGDTLAPNLVHVFTREELAQEAGSAGFETVYYGHMAEAAPAIRYAAAVLRAG